MIRLQSLGSATTSGVPYTDEEIIRLVRPGKKRGHIAGVGRVVPGRGKNIPPPPPPSGCSHADEVKKLKEKNDMLEKQSKSLMKQSKMFMQLFRSDNRFSEMLTQLQSQPTEGEPSESGGGDEVDGGSDEDAD